MALKEWEDIIARERADELIGAGRSKWLQSMSVNDQDDDGGLIEPLIRSLISLVCGVALSAIVYVIATTVWGGPIGGPSPVTTVYNDHNGQGSYYVVQDDAANYLIAGLAVVALGLFAIGLIVYGTCLLVFGFGKLLYTFGRVVNAIGVFIRGPGLSKKTASTTVDQYLNGMFSRSTFRRQRSWNCLIALTRNYLNSGHKLPSNTSMFGQLSGRGSAKIQNIQILPASKTLAEYHSMVRCNGIDLSISGVTCKIGTRWYIATWSVRREDTNEITEKVDKSDLDKFIYDRSLGQEELRQRRPERPHQETGTRRKAISYPKRISAKGLRHF